MRIAIIGASGRLGAMLTAELASREHMVAALRKDDLDITDRQSVDEVLGELCPDVVVNCSAYNAVDRAQKEVASAFALNAEGPSHLAAFARRTSGVLVHYSSDFVFDGNACEPYTEESAPAPLGVYGASKLAGEREAQTAPRHYVLRVESLFGGAGLHGHRSTIDQIADRLAAGEPVRAAIDRTVSPTYVPDAVRATVELLEREVEYGLYHCVNSGYTTWFELAQEIAHRLGVTSAEILPLRADEFQAAAPRPRFCALANAKLVSRDIMMPSWRSAVARHLAATQPARLPQHAPVAAIGRS